jgi:hypothetical protein
MTLRIYADFNSGGAPGHGSCWLLAYGSERRPLDEVADQLALKAGMKVTLYYEETSPEYTEEFEVDAILEEHNDPAAHWWAKPDWNTFRRIKG